MKKIFLVLIFLFIFGCSSTPYVCFENNCFDVDIALTESEKEKGLMYVEHLNENKGMLFVFENEGQHSFWMKNTLIPLDILWIDEDLNINHIEKNVQFRAFTNFGFNFEFIAIPFDIRQPHTSAKSHLSHCIGCR